MVSGDTAQTPDEGFTSGSQSIEYGGTALRYACAEARAILLDLALERFGLAGKTLNFEMAITDGTIFVGSQDKTVTYWELSPKAQLHREATAKVSPKPPDALKLIGTSKPRLDIPAKVTGGVAYIQDMRLPGMLFGRILRPASYGAQLVSFDEGRVKQMPGVVAVVRDGRFLGVVAEREEQAIAAREALARCARNGATSHPCRPPTTSTGYLKALPAKTTSSAKAAPRPRRRRDGARRDLHAALHGACLDRSLLRAGADEGRRAHGVDAQPGRLPAAPRPRQGAGARRIAGSAASTSKAPAATAITAPTTWRSTRRCWRALSAGRPVKVQWMRGDEFGWEPFGPAMTMSLHAALDSAA